jgi:hypothetical protein
MDSSDHFLKGVTDYWRLFCPLCDQEAIASVRAPDAAQRPSAFTRVLDTLLRRGALPIRGP